ncbi:MAG: bifunctional precorrin-2 dehydrogenase/sirohydrochlorin ferrochelatase [Nitrospirota bacterium]
MSPRYYPAFIDLKGKQCVVVGGGKVAERKVAGLLRAGAKVKVISPSLTDLLERQKQKGTIEHLPRTYRKGDLKGSFLAIAATSDDQVNTAVSKDAPCLVNVVDQPALANFIVPSVVQRGLLTIAISTSGASPAMARAMRRELEFLYGKDFGRFLDLVHTLRKRALKGIPEKRKREEFLKGMASAAIFDVLRRKGFSEAREVVLRKFHACTAATVKGAMRRGARRT